MSGSGRLDEESKTSSPPSPDGGWGWAVVFGGFMLILLVDGVCFSFGILYPEFLDYFDDSKSKTAVIGSVINGAQMGLGPVSAALVNKLGCRKVAMIGSFTSALGCGFGLMYLSSIVMVGQYFTKKRALATGIAVCGSGIGSFVFAPLCEFLLQIYPWQGAMMIISGLVLNGVVFATVFRPLVYTISCYNKNDRKQTQYEENLDHTEKLLPNQSNKVEDNEILSTKTSGHKALCDSVPEMYKCKSVEIKSTFDTDSVTNYRFDSIFYSHENINLKKMKNGIIRDKIPPLSQQDIFYSGNLCTVKRNTSLEKTVLNGTVANGTYLTVQPKEGILKRAKRTFFRTFDFSLLLEPTFAVYGASCFLCMLGFFIPFNFMPDLALSRHLTLNDAALLISVIGIANTVSRICVGFISDRSWADAVMINNVALICGGAATIFVPFYVDYGVMVTYSAVFGICIAVFVSLRSIIMVELMGIEKLTNAFGLVVLCQGLSSFIGPPIAASRFSINLSIIP
ncbi:hypothetical protein KUTeg_009097 [Tegillarca granosa]|uniref:Uncharacterized protein n=1 Tax=Tegillarca granosa TaxID=220873 RepID=A0ABQ9F7E8_TEGGR|nr:hypothetical protein KUTeg_009097 [Tegillarca granosa]